VLLTWDTLIWIPLLPLFGAAFNGLVGPHVPRMWVSVAGVLAPILSFLIALEAFLALQVQPEGAALTQTAYTWMAVGGLDLPVRFTFDALTAVMVLVVTGVGSLIHLYSVGYMDADPAYARYFAYLNLFMFAMLILVLGSSLPILFVGWEGVGLCSYLLIGFWFTDRKKAVAGMKAFVVNRIGDFGFLLGMFILFTQFGTLDVAGLEAAPLASADPDLITLACLFLFLGACGKSAQIPLYVWLPDAMAGPTPVSALIHAATMVTAGVYMVCRLGFLYVLSPEAMLVVASVGAFTALFAASVGLVQNDIKGVLAYSTVSQLGFMFIAAGCGAFTAAIFHLATHAFFKACLFLGSGSVIHAMEHAQHAAGEHGDPQDIRRMGGLRKKMPITALTFGVSCLSIAGFPLFAGFFSKDEILWKAFSNVPRVAWFPDWMPTLIYGIALVAAAGTALYMGRLFVLTFLGRFRSGDGIFGKLHESPSTMTGPLVVLGLLAVFGGFLGVPHVFDEYLGLHVPNLIAHWLDPVLGAAEGRMATAAGATAATEWTLMLVSSGIAAGGLLAAWLIWRKGPERLEGVARGAGPLYRLLRDKYRIDGLYQALIIRPLLAFSDLFCWAFVDGVLIEKVMLGVPTGTVKGAGALLRRLQNGNVQWYATLVVLGMALLLALWAFGGGG